MLNVNVAVGHPAYTNHQKHKKKHRQTLFDSEAGLIDVDSIRLALRHGYRVLVLTGTDGFTTGELLAKLLAS
uniref:Uncharacterized protein n=1 Tax=Ditylenchus dipsaci TaxID=166011 RepID=A0A915CRJ2_9BILA